MKHETAYYCTKCKQIHLSQHDKALYKKHYNKYRKPIADVLKGV